VVFFTSALPEIPVGCNRNLEKILPHEDIFPVLLSRLPHIECSLHNSLFANDYDIGKKSAGFAGFLDPVNQIPVLIAAG
tara:strand:- start:12600 stop:12836 length:237 start_codon:yes stop_codon:yes gene_type:complete